MRREASQAQLEQLSLQGEGVTDPKVETASHLTGRSGDSLERGPQIVQRGRDRGVDATVAC